MDSRKTFKLQFPFESTDGQWLETISMRRSTVGDLKAASLAKVSPSEETLLIFSRQSGLLPADVERLDMKDFESITQDPFFQNGQQTGQND